MGRLPTRVGERPHGARLEPQHRSGGVRDVGPWRRRRCLVQRGGAHDLGLADKQPREVIEVGGLLDDLAAAVVDAQPPGRCWRSVRPARGDEAGGVGGQPGADLGELLERAQVIAHGHDQPALDRRGGHARRTLRVRGGERLLREERDAPRDDRLAGRDRRRRRDRHVDDVGSLLVEHPLGVVVGRSATRPRRRLGARQAGGADTDEGRPVQPVERGQMHRRDPAGSDKAEAQAIVGHGWLQLQRGRQYARLVPQASERTTRLSDDAVVVPARRRSRGPRTPPQPIRSAGRFTGTVTASSRERGQGSRRRRAPCRCRAGRRSGHRRRSRAGCRRAGS